MLFDNLMFQGVLALIWLLMTINTVLELKQKQRNKYHVADNYETFISFNKSDIHTFRSILLKSETEHAQMNEEKVFKQAETFKKCNRS